MSDGSSDERDAADHAWAHALAVLGDPAAALGPATDAARLGGRSRTAALAHADALAIDAAAVHPSSPPTGPPPGDLSELAWALAGHRPTDERAVVDLAVRHGLDASRLGRALGLLAPAATAKAHATLADWQEALGPALLADLGPAGCDGLAAVLTAAGLDEPTIEGLVAAAPAVAAHVEGCEACGDRARAVVPIRDALAGRPVEVAPAAVRAAGRRSRFRRPTLPDRPTAGVVSARRERRGARAALTFVVLVAATVGVAAVLRERRGQTRAERVAALTKVAGRLFVSPDRVDLPGTIVLRSTSHQTVAWHAASSAPWLRVRPDSGTLEPGGTVVLQPAADGSTATSEATVTVTGDDGSSAMATVVLATGGPTVGATRKGCTVLATADDDLAVVTVALHWRAGGTEQAVPMRAGAAPGSWAGDLPAIPLTWWVSASDGTTDARTPDASGDPASC